VAITGWHGVFAPSGTPRDLLDRLETAARQAAASPRFSGRLEQDGLEAAPTRTRAEFWTAVARNTASGAARSANST
jgi:tripartite-type tricarboxylate transporter receptor subunit TctC